jgi:anti-sigma factor RsiW
MNHPYELLADLMDGTLDEGHLAGVQAHLDACVSCRDDVADATAGVRAARSMPVEDPPADLHRRVVDAAGGRGTPSWYRWAGVAAAAAAVVAIAIALPNVGTDPANVTSDAGGASAERADAAPTAAEEVVVGVEDKDYDGPALEDLAESETRRSLGASSTDGREDALFGNQDAAVRCVSRAFGNQQTGRLTRLIRARFEGEEAYIAVYLEGPGADQPPDTVAVWAASSEDCTILSFASARI